MSKKEPQKLKDIVQPLLEKDDKTAILVIGLHIEKLLLDIVKKYFPCVESAKKEFISDKQMNFYNRIQWCYRLGIIDKEFRDALDTFRKVRNDFVHDIEIVEVCDEHLDSLVSEFKYIYDTKVFDGIRGFYTETKKGEPKGDFVTFSVLMLKKLRELDRRYYQSKPSVEKALKLNE